MQPAAFCTADIGYNPTGRANRQRCTIHIGNGDFKNTLDICNIRKAG